MKYLNLFTLVFCFLTFKLFAQTPHQIEADLLKSFKKIDYWEQQCYKDTSLSWIPKLFQANQVFGKKLQFYAQKYPATISYSFNLLVKQHLDICTSSDGLFRIYSWDTETGGTMHFFANLMQYKSAKTIKAIIDTPSVDGDNGIDYLKMYTFSANGRSYYLAIYSSIGSTRDIADGIHFYGIQNGKLKDAQLIRTHSGLRSDISYAYDFWSVVNINYNKRPRIRFDNFTKTIYLPMVDANSQMTKKFVRYKFTGHYFERIKTKFNKFR